MSVRLQAGTVADTRMRTRHTSSATSRSSAVIGASSVSSRSCCSWVAEGATAASADVMLTLARLNCKASRHDECAWCQNKYSAVRRHRDIVWAMHQVATANILRSRAG